MPSDIEILFKEAELELTASELRLVEQSETPATKDISKFRTISTLYSASLLQASLIEHASALVKSAEASDRHADSLKWATWALVAATIALVIVGIIGFMSS